MYSYLLSYSGIFTNRERTERDNTIIRLVLTLFRNLIIIKDPKISESSSGENVRASMQVCLFF